MYQWRGEVWQRAIQGLPVDSRQDDSPCFVPETSSGAVLDPAIGACHRLNRARLGSSAQIPSPTDQADCLGRARACLVKYDAMQIPQTFLGPVKAANLPSAVHFREVCNHVAPVARGLRCSPSFRDKQYLRDHAGLTRCSAVAEHESAASASSADAGDGIWDAFAASVSGEWEGITATFDAQ